MCRSVGLLLLLLLGCAVPASGADRVVASPDLGSALQHFVSAPALRGARVGVIVADLDSGQILIKRNSSELLVPASNQKLLIASAALAFWGPAHRFETPIGIDGSIDGDGVLDGTLWIEGRGDPSLTSEQLWKLSEEIRLRGISQIRGGLAVDPRYFDGNRFHPDWEPISQRAYHAPISAFAANYSSFRIEITPGPRANTPARIRLAPRSSYFRVHSEVRTTQRSDRLELELEPVPDGSGERIRLRGSVPVSGAPRTFWRRVQNPEIYALSLLREQLETQGVHVRGPLRVAPRPGDVRELFRFRGESLARIVWKLDKFSNNFIAEQLTKCLGAERQNPPGTWEKGTQALLEHLREQGIATRGIVVADGSGLSARNRISAAVLLRVARAAALNFGSGPEFLSSLPLAGLDGTLEDRFVDGSAVLRGKTGHLRHVASLSGLLPVGTQKLVFSVLVNGARGDQKQVDAAIDGFVREMTSAPPPTPQGLGGD